MEDASLGGDFGGGEMDVVMSGLGQNIGCGGMQAFPDLVAPGKVFRLHEDGAEAGDRFAVAAHFCRGVGTEGERKLDEGEVEIALGGSVKKLAG